MYFECFLSTNYLQGLSRYKLSDNVRMHITCTTEFKVTEGQSPFCNVHYPTMFVWSMIIDNYWLDSVKPCPCKIQKSNKSHEFSQELSRVTKVTALSEMQNTLWSLNVHGFTFNWWWREITSIWATMAGDAFNLVKHLQVPTSCGT